MDEISGKNDETGQKSALLRIYWRQGNATKFLNRSCLMCIVSLHRTTGHCINREKGNKGVCMCGNITPPKNTQIAFYYKHVNSVYVRPAYYLNTRRVGQTSYGEFRKINPRTSRGHVCSGRFAFELFDILTFRYQN